jgi:hypothetical protein
MRSRVFHPCLPGLLLTFVLAAPGCGDDASGGNQNQQNANQNDNQNDNHNSTPGCGNGVIDGTEACDGSDLGGATCASLGYLEGTLLCDAACSLDPSGCVHGCGDGVIDGTETCDGTDLGGATCQDVGYSGGPLNCDETCTLDVTGCEGTCLTAMDFTYETDAGLTGMGEMDCRVDGTAITVYSPFATPSSCTATLTAPQESELLQAAEQVDWGSLASSYVAPGNPDCCCDQIVYEYTGTLTPCLGVDQEIGTEWCDETITDLPADFTAYLTTMNSLCEAVLASCDQ